MPKFIRKSLDAAAAVGAGAAIEFGPPVTQVSMQITTTGAPVNAEVGLEVSIDGVNFERASGVDVGSGGGSGGISIIGLIPSGQVIMVARANLVSLSGGTSPTVTATLAWTGR